MSSPSPRMFQCVLYNVNYLCSFPDPRAWYLVLQLYIQHFPLHCSLSGSQFVCQLFIERPLAAIGHCWQDTLVHYLGFFFFFFFFGGFILFCFALVCVFFFVCVCVWFCFFLVKWGLVCHGVFWTELFADPQSVFLTGFTFRSQRIFLTPKADNLTVQSVLEGGTGFIFKPDFYRFGSRKTGIKTG